MMTNSSAHQHGKKLAQRPLLARSGSARSTVVSEMQSLTLEDALA